MLFLFMKINVILSSHFLETFVLPCFRISPVVFELIITAVVKECCLVSPFNSLKSYRQSTASYKSLRSAINKSSKKLDSMKKPYGASILLRPPLCSDFKSSSLQQRSLFRSGACFLRRAAPLGLPFVSKAPGFYSPSLQQRTLFRSGVGFLRRAAQASICEQGVRLPFFLSPATLPLLFRCPFPPPCLSARASIYEQGVGLPFFLLSSLGACFH